MRYQLGRLRGDNCADQRRSEGIAMRWSEAGPNRRPTALSGGHRARTLLAPPEFQLGLATSAESGTPSDVSAGNRCGCESAVRSVVSCGFLLRPVPRGSVFARTDTGPGLPMHSQTDNTLG